MSELRDSISRPRPGFLPVVILGFLWFTLINHLRVEWSVNPQYGYGWAVPVLCAYLIWRRTKEVGVRIEASTLGSPSSDLPSPISYFLMLCLALAWLPTRLIQEANPEW